MRKRLFLLFSCILFIVSLFTGCATTSAVSDSLSIVTTCFPPYDFARAVKGSSSGITMLLSPGAEAHSYEPAPLDILTIQQCDIFIYIGGEGEVWADKILDSIDTSNMTIVKLIDYVEPLEEVEIEGTCTNEEHHHEHEHEHHEHEHEEEYDEHIWTSPENAAKMTETVCKAFISADSENSDVYVNNTENYVSELDLLDADFKEMRANAENNLIIIGDRFPFRYLAESYDLNYYAAFSGCSSETEPGVYTMAFLIEKLIETKSKYVFYLEFSTKKLAQKLCDASGAEMLPLQSCHNVTKSDFENGITYIELMRQNLENLRRALS